MAAKFNVRMTLDLHQIIETSDQIKSQNVLGVLVGQDLMDTGSQVTITVKKSSCVTGAALQETEDRRQETGDRRQETGDRSSAVAGVQEFRSQESGVRSQELQHGEHQNFRGRQW